MSIEQMRAAISKSYPSAAWRDKVARMSDNQVLAVYTRLLNQKRL